MQDSPSRIKAPRWALSSTVFAVVAVVALGSTIAFAGLGRRAHGKLGEAQAHLDAECTEFLRVRARVGSVGHAPNPCDLEATSPPVVPEVKLGKADLALAQAAARAGDEERASAALVRVLERAARIDRNGTLLASVVAASLLDGVVDTIDARPSLLEEPRVASAIRRTTFTSSRRPLESERLHALASLASVPSQVPLRTAGLVESTTTTAMDEVDAKMHAMQSALLRHDVAACEQAAHSARGVAAQVTVGAGFCTIASRVVSSGERFEALRGRARAPSSRGAMAARVTTRL